jgi:ATP-dependent 26S proteasome regulatory subunit
MIAKATASEARTRFINLDVSMLTDKWYGESQKLAAAVFTLAVKLQPCIIFIDEIGKVMCFDKECFSTDFGFVTVHYITDEVGKLTLQS